MKRKRRGEEVRERRRGRGGVKEAGRMRRRGRDKKEN